MTPLPAADGPLDSDPEPDRLTPTFYIHQRRGIATEIDGCGHGMVHSAITGNTFINLCLSFAKDVDEHLRARVLRAMRR